MGQAWVSQAQGRNLVSNRYNREGVFVLPSSRYFRDEASSSFWIQYQIVDQSQASSGPYNVTVNSLPNQEENDSRLSSCASLM